jgi:hypothetical protein
LKVGFRELIDIPVLNFVSFSCIFVLARCFSYHELISYMSNKSFDDLIGSQDQTSLLGSSAVIEP